VTGRIESRPKPFPKAAHEALRDTQLRQNIRRATSTIRDKTNRVTGELPDWQELRAAGSAIKARAMADLEANLLRLEEMVSKAGGQVHWARDAAEARRIIVGLARKHGGGDLIKVKSMTTDEIDLNPALRAAGMNPIETDLADMIVQLGNDRPSHILVPPSTRTGRRSARCSGKNSTAPTWAMPRMTSPRRRGRISGPSS